MGIVPSLNAAGVRRLDKLVLSHHDSDHDGGFQAVGKIPNGGIYAGQPEFYEGRGIVRNSVGNGTAWILSF